MLAEDDGHRFLPGAVLAGRYRIVAPLGHGGMGEVYRATDLVLDQTVALKFLPTSLADDPRALNRLFNEVRLARQVAHPNVCRVYDIVDAEGMRFLTMEYVDGEDLRSLLRRIGRVPVEKATDIARRLCAGLGAAHDCGVLHRDLKPANIMIDARGNVRITDFGLAVLSDRAEPDDIASGTPAYMAPEQRSGEQVSVRSDLYALGLVLYEMFCGHQAFTDISQRKLDKPRALAVPDVKPHVERAILRCLEPKPLDRPASAAAVATELTGGDLLTVTMAAGETPAPEMVARAGGEHGMHRQAAIACISSVLVMLIAFALIAPRTNILGRVHPDNPEALARVARDKLSAIGIREPVKHRAYRFGYDMESLRNGFVPGALYFWYRTSPFWMVPQNLTALMYSADPPVELPGMMTSTWDGTGRLLSLRVIPGARGAPRATPAEVWNRLFAAAGLDITQFQPADPAWIAAPGWDARGSWTGRYPDTKTDVRIEAASWHGLPVYFEVVPTWRQAAVTPWMILFQRAIGKQVGVFLLLVGAAAFLGWKNMRKGRGDRHGAFRLALFAFAASFGTWLCRANHVPDVSEIASIFSAVIFNGFFTAAGWIVYIALEPYVRRRWPHAIISWTRLLSGNFRDPMVGGHVLLGLTWGTALAVISTAALAAAGVYGLRNASGWILSSSSGLVSQFLALAWDAVFRGLFVLFLALVFKLLFRNEWIAGACIVAVVTAVTFVFEVPASPAPAAAVIAIVVPVVVAMTYLVLRTGLLPVIAAIYAFALLAGAPVSADLSAPGAAAAIIVLCGVGALALLAFRWTVAAPSSPTR